MGLLTMLSRRYRRSRSKEELRQPEQITPLQTSRPVSVTTHSIYMPRPQSTPCHSETQLSEVTPNQAHDFNAAKPPLNPAMRGVLDHFRPQSAESFQSGNGDRPRALQRPKREPRKPPVSFRKPGSLSSTTQSSAAGESYLQQIAGAESETMSFRSTQGRERTVSMTSTLARRLSQDILDAVDEFRPLDFRSRVQATGARDYAEDVADRNIRLFTTVSSPNLHTQFTWGRSESSQSVNINSRTKSISSVNEHNDSIPRAVSSYADSDRPDFFSKRNKNRLSLNTYKPSGFVSPVPPQTPRSPVTTPGQHGEMTPSDFDSPEARQDMWSRQYQKSPAVSNFSVQRSPRNTLSPTEALRAQLHDEEETNFPEELEFGDIIQSNRSNQRKSDLSDVQASTKAAARFSQGTYRSSLASSVTSRYPSMDFMPLGYPKSHGQAKTDQDHRSYHDDVRMWRSQSLRSHKPSRSDGSGKGPSQQRTRSLVTKPTSLTDLVESDDGMTPQPHSSSTRDWALVTTSTATDSASSSSNGLFSGASGSVRPVSRHTKATSIDSIPRPPSSQSGLSASVGQSATSGWSPSTTRSTGFNIDDYISSDDDSFTTKRRPTAEGEEELLFKGGYGATGAALPGLLESPLRASPPLRVVGFPGPGHLMTPTRMTEDDDVYNDGGEEAYDGEGAAEGPDIGDVVRRHHHHNIRDSPVTPQLRHVQDESERGGYNRTFGKQLAARPRAQSNVAPSWLPSEDWARPGSRRSQTSKRPATSYTSTSNTGMLYEDPRPAPSRRGQTRLSALGTLPGRTNLDSLSMSSGFEEENVGGGVERANSNSTKRREPAMSSLIKEEEETENDPAVALRLRKEAKARKREDEAKTIREKRMTRAFGRLDEDKLAALQAQGEEMETRGRTRVRVFKGKSVVSS